MPGLHRPTYPPTGSAPWTMPLYQSEMLAQSNLSPTLKFFIERENGSLVPLVPVDELSDDIRLVGVPQQLGPFQAKNMVFCGHYASVTGKFQLDGSLSINESAMPSAMTVKCTPQAGVVQDHFPRPINTQSIAAPISAPGPIPKAPAPQRQKPFYNERPLPPSGIEPDQRKKIYCTYWIQKGQCNFKQQGCLYKHEMPTDKKTLESIGLNSIPVWWRKQQKRQERAMRNGSSSEWEVVEQQLNATSALHSDDAVRVCMPTVRPKYSQTVKHAGSKSNVETLAQNKTASDSFSPDSATTDGSPYSSSPGGVRLGAAKGPVRAPQGLSLGNQTLESPIEDDLINFDVLVPSSSPDSYPGSELHVHQDLKEKTALQESRHASNGGVSISLSNGAGQGTRNSGRNRRGSPDKKNRAVTPPRQPSKTIRGRAEKGKENAEHGNGMSRRGKVKNPSSTDIAKAKATGEIGMQSDGEA